MDDRSKVELIVGLGVPIIGIVTLLVKWRIHGAEVELGNEITQRNLKAAEQREVAGALATLLDEWEMDARNKLSRASSQVSRFDTRPIYRYTAKLEDQELAMRIHQLIASGIAAEAEQGLKVEEEAWVERIMTVLTEHAEIQKQLGVLSRHS